MNKDLAHKTIHLRIYKGKPGVKGIAKNEAGKVINENHLVKLSYGSLEWDNYMKNLRVMNFVKVEVVGFYDKTDKDGSFVYNEAPEDVLKEVDSSMTAQEEVPLTPQQKEIAELKAQMAEFLGSKKTEKKSEAPQADNTPNINEELDAARARYKEVFGKKPNTLLKLETLNNKIAEEQSK